MNVVTGMRVRHRREPSAGVVLSIEGSMARVAFAQGHEFVSAADLIALDLEPDEALAAGEMGDPAAAQIRLLARMIQHAYAFDESAALSNARLEPKLHQAFVAHRVVAQKVAPRMILADEVGLGKTIEAGLIIKELRARADATRVLIITPASLVRQWQSEMSSKFNEPFEIMDRASATHLGRGGKNPFLAADRVLCSLPFACQSKRADEIIEAGWDLVVFDEAHRVRRSGTGPSARRVTEAYRLADELRDRVHGLLLLSATPVQLHSYELYSLIELVEPGLFSSFEAFERQRATIPALNTLMHALMHWEVLSIADRLAVANECGPLLSAMGMEVKDLSSIPGLEKAKERLQEQHPLVNALVRNRKSELGMQNQRSAKTILVTPTSQEAEIYERVTDYLRFSYTRALGQKNNAVGFLMVIYQKMLTSSSHALRVSLRRRITRLNQTLDGDSPRARPVDRFSMQDPEEQSEALVQLELADQERAYASAEIEQLESLVTALDEIRDSKIGELIKLVKREIDEQGSKLVIFTQFIETQTFLAKALELNSVSVSVFNGVMKPEEKENSILEFRTRTEVLISTEAGGEGRNLQFANVLVNYDLPWNPMKVEQRIGRLDRIGQLRPVRIYNLICEGTLDERIIDVLDRRIRLFEESVGALDPILGEIEKDIERLALHEPNPESGFTDFAEDIEKRVAQARLLERTMADFVLDRASFRHDEAQRLLGAQSLAEPLHLEELVRTGLDYLGGTLLPHTDGGNVVTLSPRLANRLGLKSPSWRGVFDPVVAVQKDELDFFAFGHPLVDRLLSAFLVLPDAAVGYRVSDQVPEGTWVEVIREFSAQVIVGKGRLVRHLVSVDGEVRSEVVTRLPMGDRSVPSREVSWVAEGVARSSDVFRQEYDDFRAEMDDLFRRALEERRKRLKRVHDSQVLRLNAQIASEDAWLAERRQQASSRDRKVIPAREGRLAKARARLSGLREEFDMQDERLASEELDVRARVIGAAIVIGEKK